MFTGGRTACKPTPGCAAGNPSLVEIHKVTRVDNRLIGYLATLVSIRSFVSYLNAHRRLVTTGQIYSERTARVEWQGLRLLGYRFFRRHRGFIRGRAW